MKIRLSISFFFLTVVLSLPALVFAEDQRLRVNQDEAWQPTESVTDNAQTEQIIPIPILIQQLNLKLFDAANGELSICMGEAPCLYFAQQIKAWRCASNVCEQGKGGARPAACFADQFKDYSAEDQVKISQAICSIVKSPTQEAKISLLDLAPDMSEHVLVENIAYLWAFKKNVDQCVAVIKDFVGEFGPNWNFRWYRALSGCRILAQESTRQKEEKDFSTWFGLKRGEGQCSDIKNITLKEACEIPEAPSPKPGFEFLPGISSLDNNSRQALLDELGLKEFLGTASGDSSLCKDDRDCLKLMDIMAYWICVENACLVEDKLKDPISCFKEVTGNVSMESRNNFNANVCSLINSSDKVSREAFLAANPELGLAEGDIVRDMAYRIAQKGDAKSCEQIIKDYLGPYGPQWKSVWYVNLSGCRILARESTYEQERKDFAAWFSVLEGAGNCSGIKNSELKNACNTAGATSPKPVYEK